MNLYYTEFINNARMIKGTIQSNFTLNKINEYMININICNKVHNITNLKKWIGFVNQTHCTHENYIDFYKNQSMNMIITNKEINTTLPVAYISQDLSNFIYEKFKNNLILVKINNVQFHTFYTYLSFLILIFTITFCCFKFIKNINDYYLTKYKNLKFKKKKKYNNRMNEIICTICIEEFKENEEIYQIKCNHIYHIDCLDSWITTKGDNVKCPNCNENIFETIKEPLLNIV